MKKLLSLILLLSFNIKAQDVKIGTQTWTTKNLDVTKYRNGDAIPQVQDKNAWANLTTGAWCYFENKTANGTKYGKLYNWYAVNDPRGLAPKCYHIPSDEEWTMLTDDLGGKSVAGKIMKRIHGYGTNVNGFAALPGGGRYDKGDFYDIGFVSTWWSSSEATTGLAWKRILGSLNDDVTTTYDYMQDGFSVRCIKD